MRKGLSLLEMLVVLVLFTSISVVLAEVFSTLLGDIPRSCRVVQANTSLLNMLNQMHKDVEIARQLPQSFADYTTNDELFLIELADGMICYQLEDDRIVRRRLTGAGQDSDEGMRVWPVHNGKVEWRVWRKDDNGYAVEIKTHIAYRVRGHWQRKMVNSHLYFMSRFRGALR